MVTAKWGIVGKKLTSIVDRILNRLGIDRQPSRVVVAKASRVLIMTPRPRLNRAPSGCRLGQSRRKANGARILAQHERIGSSVLDFCNPRRIRRYENA